MDDAERKHAALAEFEAAYKPRMEAAARALTAPGGALEKATSGDAQIEVLDVVQMFIGLAGNTARAEVVLSNWPFMRQAFVETLDACLVDYVKFLKETRDFMHGTETVMGTRPL